MHSKTTPLHTFVHGRCVESYLGRQELARNATGEVFFKPGALVLQEGRQRRTPQWYVVVKGSALVSKKGPGGEDLEVRTSYDRIYIYDIEI